MIVELNIARDTMLIEVSGINIAAMIGSNSPLIANHKPTILYKIETPKLKAITRLPVLQ